MVENLRITSVRNSNGKLFLSLSFEASLTKHRSFGIIENYEDPFMTAMYLLMVQIVLLKILENLIQSVRVTS